MRKGVVAAGHELTAEAAGRVLREGGNAFDAVIAAHLAACVTEPVLASLGGGGFLLAKPTGGEPVVYDFFVQTPKRKRSEYRTQHVTVDFGTAQQEFHIGQGTIATPGAVKGIFEIHRDLGSLPMGQIAGAAIEYARKGVTLTPLQAYILQIVSPIYLATAEVRDVFAGGRSGTTVLRAGATMRRPELAETIERLVAEGDDAFYRGDFARRIVAQSEQQGGHLSNEDLESYEVVKRKPLVVDYRGSQVVTNPPPSAAGILITFALELMRTLDGCTRIDEQSYPLLLAEVMELTSQARADAAGAAEHHGDDPLASLVDPDFLALYQQQIAHRAQAFRGTTHISAVDSAGNLAAMTISNGEGCGDMVPQTGIMLNNMLGETDVNVRGLDAWKEDQRLTSMMSPSLITRPDGSVLALGSGGSNRIRTALLQVIMNLIHFEMDLEAAVMHPRMHLEHDKLSLECGFSPELVAALKTRYPNQEVWDERNLFFGGVHTVLFGPDASLAFGDPRRAGASYLA